MNNYIKNLKRSLSFILLPYAYTFANVLSRTFATVRIITTRDTPFIPFIAFYNVLSKDDLLLAVKMTNIHRSSSIITNWDMHEDLLAYLNAHKEDYV